MAKHLKDSFVPKARYATDEEKVTAYNVWIRLNPEYAADNELCDAEIADLDAELESLWESYQSNALSHGFNGHDPLLETEETMNIFPMSFIDMGYNSFDYDDYYDDQYDDDFDPLPSYSRCRYDDDWPEEADLMLYSLRQFKAERELEERIREEEECDLDAREREYSHLPHLQSMRMGVRERVNGKDVDCRWNHRPYERHLRATSYMRQFEGLQLPYGKPADQKRHEKWQRNKPQTRPFSNDWYKSA
jgi:hypothetical protein